MVEWLLLVPFLLLGGVYGTNLVLASEEEKNREKIMWTMLFEL